MAKGKNYSNHYFSNKHTKGGVSQFAQTNQKPLYLFEKNKCYDFAKGQAEGAIFNMTDSGASLYVFFENPTSHEQEQFKASHPLEIKTLEMKDVLIMLFKFGDLPWFEAPYNVHLSPNWNNIPNSVTGNSGFALTIHLFDTTDGKLVHNRLYTIPHDISVEILKAVQHQQKMEYSDTQYDQHMREVCFKYTTDELVALTSGSNDSASTKETQRNTISGLDDETIAKAPGQATNIPDTHDANALSHFLKNLPYGCRFEMTDTGATLKILAIEPSDSEIKQLFSAKNLLVRTLEIENVVYLLFKFGDTPWCVAPYNAYYDSVVNTNRISNNNESLNLLVELYDVYNDKTTSSKQVTLSTDISAKILKIIKRQIEEPFNLEQYIDILKAVPAMYTPEHLVMLATSNSRFDSIEELEQEWHSKYTGISKLKYYILDRPMTYQLAADMQEVAAILKGTVDDECVFLFHKAWYHYKAGKLYANYILVPNTVNRGIMTILSEIGERYQN